MDDLPQREDEVLDDLAQALTRLTRGGRDLLLSRQLEVALEVIGDERHLAALDTTVEQQQAARQIGRQAQAAREELAVLRQKWEAALAWIREREGLLADVRHELEQKEGVAAQQARHIASREGDLAAAQERVRQLERQLDTTASEVAEKDERLQHRSAEAERLRAEFHNLQQRLQSTQEQLEAAQERIRGFEAAAKRTGGSADQRAEGHPEALSRGSSAQASGVEQATRTGSAAVVPAARSPAGLWTRVADSAFPLRGAMRSVTAGGPGVVAVGHDDGSGQAAVWTSTDGLSWDRVRGQTESLGGGSRHIMYSVTRGGPGLAAVGADAGQGRPAAWTSVDGRAWTRSAIADLDVAGKGIREMRSVAAGGPGLVAVGYDQTRRAAAVWTSTTGESWERLAHDEAVFGGDGQQLMSEVICGGPGLVAVGRARASRQTGLIWVSDDGLTWTRLDAHGSRASYEFLRAMRKREVRSVTRFGTSLVAVGRHVDGPAVWLSEDGFTWSRVAIPPKGGSMSAVTAVGSRLVAVGFRASRPSVWSSHDGLSWSRSEGGHSVFDDGAMHSVAAIDQGVVAVGERGDRPAVWRLLNEAEFGRT